MIPITDNETIKKPSPPHHSDESFGGLMSWVPNISFGQHSKNFHSLSPVNDKGNYHTTSQKGEYLW